MVHTNTSWLHMGLTAGHIGVTCASVVMSVIFVIYSLGVGCSGDDCSPTAYITSTFFSSNKIGSLSGWAVATERAQMGEAVQYPADKDAFAFSHFFECMYSSNLASGVCGGRDSVPSYVACLRNDTSATGALAALTACDALSASFSQPWPTSEEYMQCLFRFKVMYNSDSLRGGRNVFKTCVDKSMWPFFEVQQGIDTPLFLGSFNWVILLTVGFLSMTSFAVYTASPVEQGLVQKGEPRYLMRLGTLWVTISFVWLVIFFSLYLSVAVRDNGNLPTTVSTSVVTISVLGVCLLYFGSELVEAKDFEFGVHGYNYVRHHGGNAARNAYDAVTRHGKVIFGKSKTDGKLGTSMLNPALDEYTIDAKGVAEYYTPPLLAAWADGYFPDACIFLGAAGASGQLTTDNAWHIFTLVLFYRGLNMMIARFMYQCFMNNLAFEKTDEFNFNKENHGIITYPSEIIKSMSANSKSAASKAGSGGRYQKVMDGDDREEFIQISHPETVSPHINVQVMALSAQIAAIYILSALCFLVFNNNLALSDFTLFQVFFILGFLIPEGLRISIHLICQVYEPSPGAVPWNLLNASMFVWIWDLSIRLIFISIIFFSSAEYPGTRLFLVQKSHLLLGKYVDFLA